jgi:hypothetical protein
MPLREIETGHATLPANGHAAISGKTAKDIGYCFGLCWRLALFAEAPPLSWALSRATQLEENAIKPPVRDIPCSKHPLTLPVFFL